VSATRILWGQVIAVFAVVLAAIWVATEWTAWRLGFQLELGRPWFALLNFPVYVPPAFFWWWFAYDAYAPRVFIEGANIAASGGVIAAGIAIGMSVWRAREVRNAETYGSARWAKQGEIARAGLVGPDGVVLGRYERAVDLAHFFETDVVQLRFARQLPEALADSARDAFLRTLAEALRLAACRLIRIDRRDLRSTYVYTGGPVVALYDGIPGGAGYSRRVGTEDVPIRRLLEEAADILECRRGRCASSCRACLNDYANQLWWDIFDRRPVLEWIRSLIDERAERITGGEFGAVRWATPSLTELVAKFTGRADVFFCAPNLSPPEPDPASVRAALGCLREMAKHNTRLNLVTTSGSAEGVTNLPAAERALFRYLGEFAAPDLDRLRWLQAPVPGPHTPIHAMPARGVLSLKPGIIGGANRLAGSAVARTTAAGQRRAARLTRRPAGTGGVHTNAQAVKRASRRMRRCSAGC
jgi:hypothetical protein